MILPCVRACSSASQAFSGDLAVRQATCVAFRHPPTRAPCAGSRADLALAARLAPPMCPSSWRTLGGAAIERVAREAPGPGTRLICLRAWSGSPVCSDRVRARWLRSSGRDAGCSGRRENRRTTCAMASNMPVAAQLSLALDGLCIRAGSSERWRGRFCARECRDSRTFGAERSGWISSRRRRGQTPGATRFHGRI